MGSPAKPGIRTKELILDDWIFAVLISAILRSPSPSRQATKNAGDHAQQNGQDGSSQAPTLYVVDQAPVEITLGDVRLAWHRMPQHVTGILSLY